MRITQNFGPAATPELAAYYALSGWEGHNGTDLAAIVGTPVIASHDGWCEPRWSKGLGDNIRIHGDGFQTGYGHLSAIYVAREQEVRAGDVIGLSGTGGTGPHLHWELQINGVSNPAYGDRVDPMLYVREASMFKTTVQSQKVEPWMADVLQEWGVGWWKGINPPETDSFPNIPNKNLRIWTDDIDWSFISRGEEGGRDFVRHMLPRWRALNYQGNVVFSLANEPSGPNDPGLNSNEGIRLLTDYSIGAMYEASANGIRMVIGEWPEGSWHDNGTGDEAVTKRKMQQFAPAVQVAGALGHYVGRHCYWRPGVEGPLGGFHALGRLDKDVRWWQEARVNIDGLQVLVTETGIDGGIEGHTPGEGWQTFVERGVITADDYYKQVAEAEQWARERPWCKALMLFLAGYTDDKWKPFNHDETACRGIMREIDALPSPEPTMDTITDEDMSRAHAVFATVNATQKDAATHGDVFLRELGHSVPGQSVLYILYDPEVERFKVAKLHPQTWKRVAEANL